MGYARSVSHGSRGNVPAGCVESYPTELYFNLKLACSWGQAMQRLVVAILLGITLSAAITAAICGLTPDAHAPWTVSFAIFRNIALAVAAVLPGFLAGWVAGRSGIVAGALVGVGVAVVSPFVAFSFWGFFPVQKVLITIAVGIVTNVITQCVGGVAGETLRRRFAF